MRLNWRQEGPVTASFRISLHGGSAPWGRSVYRVGPSKGYLATLVCEGGLPLKLILREGTPLRHYLKGVLEEFKHFGATETPARDLAERLRHRLPGAWRRETVYELSGELIEAVWMLPTRTWGDRYSSSGS